MYIDEEKKWLFISQLRKEVRLEVSKKAKLGVKFGD